MGYELGSGSHPSKPVQTSANGFGEWLSVSEAVVFCEQVNLNRENQNNRPSYRGEGQLITDCRNHGGPDLNIRVTLSDLRLQQLWS